MVKSSIYTGFVYHKRFLPVTHDFKYPVYFFSLDLNELAFLNQSCFGFSVNRFNLFSFYENDYLYGFDGPLFDRVKAFLKSHQANKNVVSVRLVTTPKFLGKGFNPVSFFYCYDQNDCLNYVIAEVNNTFRQTHTYLLTNCNDQQKKYRFHAEKVFHVSPFFTLDGNYQFNLSDLSSEAILEIDYFKDKKKYLYAVLSGKQRDFKSWLLFKTFLQFPFSILLTFPRIVYEAIRLFFVKKLMWYHKPMVSSDNTFSKHPPTFLQRLYLNALKNRFSKIKGGFFQLELPNKTVLNFGDVNSKEHVSLKMLDYRLLNYIVTRGSMGFGESYMLGYWTSDDIVRLMMFFIENRSFLYERKGLLSNIAKPIFYLQHKLLPNTVSGSKKNIQEHYDLGNDFFSTFLDDSMLYSSALYPKKDMSLELAQEAKINEIITKLDIQQDHHVLEIGSGWGTLAIEMAKRTGCKVTTITISQKQFEHVKQRIDKESIGDKVCVILKDYRLQEGVFDRIVSIEMIEAVGHKYLPVYFGKINDLLSDKGKLFIQGITIPDELYETYTKSSDWIRKYIFPGGHLPCLGIINKIITESTSLTLDTCQNIGKDYAETLKDWRIRFQKEVEVIKSMGFDQEFINKWIYYFIYCEVGFRTDLIHNHQMVFIKK
tara:strand:- start:100 stop:2061 length:1962 start_codon:yes stop_codon:yes gene_type:complete